MKIAWSTFSIITLTLFIPGTARANMVQGGSFESPVVPLGSQYIINVTPTGWSGTGDIAEQGYAGAVSSGYGNQWFDLNPGLNAGNGILQNVSLDAGKTYKFSFIYNGGGGGTTTEISYSIDSVTETVLSGAVSTAQLNVYAGTPWSTFSTTFVPATSGTKKLLFLPNGSYSGGFIDSVSINLIPEPYSLGLLTIGGLALLGRHRF